jgi:hypothetical protein
MRPGKDLRISSRTASTTLSYTHVHIKYRLIPHCTRHTHLSRLFANLSHHTAINCQNGCVKILCVKKIPAKSLEIFWRRPHFVCPRCSIVAVTACRPNVLSIAHKVIKFYRNTSRDDALFLNKASIPDINVIPRQKACRIHVGITRIRHGLHLWCCRTMSVGVGSAGVWL